MKCVINKGASVDGAGGLGGRGEGREEAVLTAAPILCSFCRHASQLLWQTKNQRGNWVHQTPRIKYFC